MNVNGHARNGGVMSGRTPGKARHHADPRFVKMSRVIRGLADGDPLAVCAKCGKTLTEHRTRTGRADKWQAGHTEQGSTTWLPWLDVRTVPPKGDWLAAEARSCNAADGARIRNARSASSFDW